MTQLTPTTRRVRQARSEAIARFATPRELLVEGPQDYRSFFDNAVEGIFRTSPGGRYLAVNRALAAMYRYASPEEMLAGITDIGAQLYVDPQRRQIFRMLLSRQDTVSDFEAEVRCRDGTPIWIREKARAVRADDGRLLYYEGFVENITEERRQRASSALCERAMRSSPDALAVFARNGALTWCNPAFVALCGDCATVDALLASLEPAGQPATWRSSRGSMLRCGTAFRDQVIVRERSGAIRQVGLSGYAVAGEGDEMIGIALSG